VTHQISHLTENKKTIILRVVISKF